jgi:hypothetical protein
MSRTNFLIVIRECSGSPETRHISVYADDEDAAREMGHVAANAMDEDFHNGRAFYVEQVIPLE